MSAGNGAHAITAEDVRVELALDGVKSVVSGGLLALAEASRRNTALLERILEAIENQTKLLTRANGHARHDAHQSE